MHAAVRTILIGSALAQASLAAGFFFQMPFATALWPFSGTTPLSFILLASILAASAASLLWVGATGHGAALAGIGLDALTIALPLTVLTARHADASALAWMPATGAAVGLLALVWALRQPLDRSVAMPRGVWWSFLLFVAALLLVSTQLLRGVPDVIPWKITPELSVLVGWMFLGASAYFLYGLLRPCWANAGGQLAGFLAYDLVLIVPFLERLPTVAPEHRTGLIVYLAVVIYSGVLAVYTLFIQRPAVRARG